MILKNKMSSIPTAVVVKGYFKTSMSHGTPRKI